MRRAAAGAQRGENDVRINDDLIHKRCPSPKRLDALLFFLFGPYPAFGSRLLDDLLGYLAGDGVIVRELHVEGAAGGGDGVELGLVIQHLGHRNLSLDDLVLAAHVHALHSASARVEVAHDVPARLDGRDYLYVHYRFEYGRLHLLDGVAKSFASRGAE